MKNQEENENGGVPPSRKARVAKNRRRLVGALAASGAGTMLLSLPDSWKRPIVESVALPAHGQTTDEPDEPDDSPDLSDGEFQLTTDIALRAPGGSILDYFSGTAHAGSANPSEPQYEYFSSCLELSDGFLLGAIDVGVDTFDCLIEYDDPDGAPLGGSIDADSIDAGLSEYNAECQSALSPGTLTFLSITGKAPNRTLRIRLTTSDGSRDFDCPEGCRSQ